MRRQLLAAQIVIAVPRQRKAGFGIDPGAVLRLCADAAHVAQNAAGALRDPGRTGIRGADQRHGDRGFVGIQP